MPSCVVWYRWLYPYPSGLLHCYWEDHMIASVPVKQRWRIKSNDINPLQTIIQPLQNKTKHREYPTKYKHNITEMEKFSFWWIFCLHFDEIFITGCTGTSSASQWWKLHQNHDIFISVIAPVEVRQPWRIWVNESQKPQQNKTKHNHVYILWELPYVSWPTFGIHCIPCLWIQNTNLRPRKRSDLKQQLKKSEVLVTRLSAVGKKCHRYLLRTIKMYIELVCCWNIIYLHLISYFYIEMVLVVETCLQ